jgi:hypothetical protein
MNINDGKKINKDGTFLGGCSACHSIDSGFPVRNPRSSNKGVWKARPTQSGPCGITWRVVTAVEPQRVVLKNYRGILHTDLEFSSSVFWIDLGFRILLPCDLLQLKCPQDTPWGTGRMETWAVWLYWQCAMLISKFPVLRSEAMHNSTLLQRNALKVGAWVNGTESRTGQMWGMGTSTRLMRSTFKPKFQKLYTSVHLNDFHHGVGHKFINFGESQQPYPCGTR